MTDPATVSSSSDHDDADAQLLWQVAARADLVLQALGANQNPSRDLSALLGFLREVVLVRITAEDRELLPDLRRAASLQTTLERLRRDHLSLRNDIEDLAAAVSTPGDGLDLPVIVRRLVQHLEDHVFGEAAALATLSHEHRSIHAEWYRAQNWYPLTEGPQIDMRQLHPDIADAAVLSRLRRLAVGDHVEVHGHGDSKHLRSQLQRLAPGAYGWSEDQRDPDGWAVTVTRRGPD